ncbi:Spy/CpxP family protein refolding chaperone [Inquilinus sp. OTU3971]|uniref:Spy/CpxP family protein refolding chaperone n=1 Tax=Inquilinus sp. OTU3971 TaxID=3043855 RepID=UPI00313D8272
MAVLIQVKDEIGTGWNSVPARSACRQSVAGGTAMSIRDIVALLRSAVLAAAAVLGGTSIAAASVDAPVGLGDRTEVTRDPHGMAVCGYWLGDAATRDLAWIKEIVKPTEGQRASFDALELAVQEAQETMRAACRAGPSDEPEELPREVEAMLLAFAMIYPVLDAFYGQLSDDQKSRLDSAMGWGDGEDED